MLEYKKNMGPKELRDFEDALKSEYFEHKSDTEKDLNFRLSGVSATRGSTGKQFVGYDTLTQFYRGDQWDHDEPPGASQKTDNYCSVIVDNFSSLLFDAPVEINCPSQDESDDVLEMMAETKERLLSRVYDDNDADEIIFPELSKCGSLYGDAFIKGPLIDKNDSDNPNDWKVVFFNVENPANIRPIFEDENYKKIYGFIDTTSISPVKAGKAYQNKLRERNIDIKVLISKATKRSGQRFQPNVNAQQTNQKMLLKSEYWTSQVMAIFLEDELVDWWWHDWGFVPLEYIKNIHVPNHPYGKSDLEDVIDPQLGYNTTKNDLANALKFLSTINLKGKNLDGMEVLVHGLSKIFNLPEDGDLDPIQRSGDPYASGNQVDNNRRAILDVSGVSEALMSTVGSNLNPSGRAMAVALQSVIRKLNPRVKRYQKALKSLNKNIFKLLEKYWPQSKQIIMGDYTNEVSIISTVLRNIVDEINKLQSGTQSLTTTQKNLGIPQPKIEQKRMKKDLSDPILGPQFARQPGILQQTQMSSPEGEPGTPGSEGQGLPNVPNQGGARGASPEGSVTANNQRAGGAAPVPVVTK
jgi:hypothetical protein